MGKRSIIKVLKITADHFPPFRVDLTELFGSELSKRDYEFTWLMPSSEPADHWYESSWDAGRALVSARPAGDTLLAKIRGAVAVYVNELRALWLARKHRFDVIEARDSYFGALVGLLAAKLTGAKFVYWLSFPSPEAWLHSAESGLARFPKFNYVRGMLAKRFLYRFVAKRADLIFVQSEEMKRRLLSEYAVTAKMVAVPMGVSDDLEVPSGEGEYPPDWVEGKSAVVYLGAVAAIRQPEFMISAHKALLELGTDAMLYVVGPPDHPSDMQLVEEAIAEAGVSHNVVCTGGLERSAALKYVRFADVCICPLPPHHIWAVSSPTKVLEYMALKKVVVATDQPDQKFILEDSGAGSIADFDPKKFALAISALLNDDLKREAMARRGRDYVLRNRSYSKIATMVDAAYRSL